MKRIQNVDAEENPWRNGNTNSPPRKRAPKAHCHYRLHVVVVLVVVVVVIVIFDASLRTISVVVNVVAIRHTSLSTECGHYRDGTRYLSVSLMS